MSCPPPITFDPTLATLMLLRLHVAGAICDLLHAVLLCCYFLQNHVAVMLVHAQWLSSPSICQQPGGRMFELAD